MNVMSSSLRGDIIFVFLQVVEFSTHVEIDTQLILMFKVSLSLFENCICLTGFFRQGMISYGEALVVRPFM